MYISAVVLNMYIYNLLCSRCPCFSKIPAPTWSLNNNDTIRLCDTLKKQNPIQAHKLINTTKHINTHKYTHTCGAQQAVLRALQGSQALLQLAVQSAGTSHHATAARAHAILQEDRTMMPKMSNQFLSRWWVRYVCAFRDVRMIAGWSWNQQSCLNICRPVMSGSRL